METKKPKKPPELIKSWILSSLIKGDKKIQEILNEHKKEYYRAFGEFLTYNHIDKNLIPLMDWQIVSLVKEKPKTYHINQGCFNGRLIYKITRGRILNLTCENPTQCKCPEREPGIKEVNEQCIYWDLLKKLQPSFKIKI